MMISRNRQTSRSNVHGQGDDDMYVIVIEQLPRDYGWQELKDAVRAMGAQHVRGANVWATSDGFRFGQCTIKGEQDAYHLYEKVLAGGVAGASVKVVLLRGEYSNATRVRGPQWSAISPTSGAQGHRTASFAPRASTSTNTYPWTNSRMSMNHTQNIYLGTDAPEEIRLNTASIASTPRPNIVDSRTRTTGVNRNAAFSPRDDGQRPRRTLHEQSLRGREPRTRLDHGTNFAPPRSRQLARPLTFEPRPQAPEFVPRTSGPLCVDGSQNSTRRFSSTSDSDDD